MHIVPQNSSRLEAQAHLPDLRGAFNDGYELFAHPLTAMIFQWMVITGALVALTVGGVRLVGALFALISIAAGQFRMLLL